MIFSRTGTLYSLKKIGGMEFYDVIFSYIDKGTLEKHYVSYPSGVAGQSHTGMIGIYKLENEIVSGTGKFDKSVVSPSREARESLDATFRYFTSNDKSISNSISTRTKNYVMHVSDLQGIGLTEELAVAEFN